MSEAAIARARNFGPPAPPKGKKGPKAGFAAKERGPKGPIPTKFTGRAFSLDDQDEAPAGGDDALPDFMKADADADTGADDAGDDKE
jgi:hypothetical protein